VARLIDADAVKMTLVTTANQIIGTLQYLAPECLGPEHAGEADAPAARIPAVDIRSDIYALRVTLFELLADRTPYALEGVALPVAIWLIRESQPPSLGGIDRAMGGDIDTIVRKAMEKEKERRYQSAAELSADIRRYLNHEPIMAHPPSATYHIRTFARRNKALVTGVAAAFVILLAAIIGVSAALSRSMRMEQQAIVQRDRARKDRRVSQVHAGVG
jgi:eukaryotic-like serine/threonine-protein kinase